MPSRLDVAAGQAVIYLRSARTLRNAQVAVTVGGETLMRKRYPVMRPPEMERLVLDLTAIPAGAEKVILNLKGEENG